jgi:hypothetical protein
MRKSVAAFTCIRRFLEEARKQAIQGHLNRADFITNISSPRNPLVGDGAS